VTPINASLRNRRTARLHWSQLERNVIPIMCNKTVFYRILGITLAVTLAFGALNSCASTPRAEREAEREIELGQALAARLIRKYGLVRNEEVTRYLNLVAAGIGRQASRPELRWRAGVLDSSEWNAFAAPGGYLLITRGALQSMQDEAELAFVLAHEMSHVALRHEAPTPSAGWSDFLISMMGGGMVSQSVENAAGDIEERLLGDGRDHSLEYEADRSGAVYASLAGYDPRAALVYLRRMQGDAASERVRTHPPVNERVRDLERFLAENGLTGGQRNRARFLRYRGML